MPMPGWAVVVRKRGEKMFNQFQRIALAKKPQLSSNRIWSHAKVKIRGGAKETADAQVGTARLKRLLLSGRGCSATLTNTICGRVLSLSVCG